MLLAARFVEERIPAEEYARRHGFLQSAVEHRIRAGILSGVQEGDSWYVIRRVYRKATPAPRRGGRESVPLLAQVASGMAAFLGLFLCGGAVVTFFGAIPQAGIASGLLVLVLGVGLCWGGVGLWQGLKNGATATILSSLGIAGAATIGGGGLGPFIVTYAILIGLVLTSWPRLQWRRETEAALEAEANR